MKLFEILTEEAVAALTREALSEYITTLRSVAEKIHAKDADTIGELSASEVLEQMREGVAALKAADARLTELTEAEASEGSDAEIEALAAEARGEEAPAEAPAAVEPEAAVEEAPAEEEAPEAPAEEEAPEELAAAADLNAIVAEKVAEALAAAAESAEEGNAPNAKPVLSLVKPAAGREAPEQSNGLAMTASAEGLPVTVGTEFEDMNALAAAMIHKRRNFGHMSARENVAIGRADWADSYPEERILDPRDGGEQVKAKVDAMLASLARDPHKATDKALIASGGICAPVTPLYDLPVISQADRPVRASLPSFLASRGGIQFATPPTMADVSTAVGIITAAEDGAGGSFAEKACQVLECPDWNEVTIDIIYHCVQTSNLTNRTFPEQLAQFNQLVLATLARIAESKLLDGISGGSTQVTAADINLGASGSLLTEILAAANGMRNRHRMRADAVLRVMLPYWSVDLMISDVIRTQFQRFDTDRAKIMALLRSFNVEPTFYIDGETGASQIFGAQTAGDLLPFPETVVWYLFPEGTFLFLDGGTLELGLVRDSVLNSTNEFQLFGEQFENVAMVGIESLAVTSTVCDNGIVAIPDTIVCGDYANGN